MLSLSLGLSLTSVQGASAGAAFDPASLFDSDTGFIFDLSNTDTVFQDAAGGETTPSEDTDPLGTILDLSGNDNHVSTADADTTRPTYSFAGGVGYATYVEANSQYSRAVFTLDQTYTLVVSVRYISGAAAQFDCFVDGGTAFSTALMLGNGSGGGGTVAALLYSGGLLGPQDIEVGEDFVATLRFSSTTSRIAKNNDAYASDLAATTDPAGGVCFGARGDGAGAFIGMRLYRAIGIGRDLTDSEIADARAWCAAPAGVSL
jgi:hypothetical protein